MEMLVYMDDIIVYSKKLEEHERKIPKLFDRLTKANVVLQPEKCEFLKLEVAYLGHIITQGGVKPDPGKIETIVNFPSPKCTKDVRSFLGTTGYYHRFIKNYAKISKNLAELTSKNVRFHWNPIHEEEYQKLKIYLCTEPIFTIPRFRKTIQTDN